MTRNRAKSAMNAQKLAGRPSPGRKSRPGGPEQRRPHPRRQGSDPGFTLIELMIVVVVIGILAAIGIPNYVAMQKRASEGSVKSNMHTLQMSVEDFGLLNDGQYPANGTDVVPDGRSLAQVCPTGGYPRNPYTKTPSVVDFNADPSAGNKGELALNPALNSGYVVKGNGSEGTILPLTLTSGQ